ncbi:Eukaryotic translation initiation factor 2-alpha kinase [Gonapodya sp. JEL0774]|nr:Eukaryotic translation initiation factor 2-alpha kinase [Gonapodya sp. JEL0774]
MARIAQHAGRRHSGVDVGRGTCHSRCEVWTGVVNLGNHANSAKPRNGPTNRAIFVPLGEFPRDPVPATSPSPLPPSTPPATPATTATPLPHLPTLSSTTTSSTHTTMSTTTGPDMGRIFVATIRDKEAGGRGAVEWGGASRYLGEFEELAFLGKGGFGAVFRARNRLDGQEYAVKKSIHAPTTPPTSRNHSQSHNVVHPPGGGGHPQSPSEASPSDIRSDGSVSMGGAGDTTGTTGTGSVVVGGDGRAGTGRGVRTRTASAGRGGGGQGSGHTGPVTGTGMGTGTGGHPLHGGTNTNTGTHLGPDDARIIREVKTFARISNHPNVVRYFNSWVEAVFEGEGAGTGIEPKGGAGQGQAQGVGGPAGGKEGARGKSGAGKRESRVVEEEEEEGEGTAGTAGTGTATTVTVRGGTGTGVKSSTGGERGRASKGKLRAGARGGVPRRGTATDDAAVGLAGAGAGLQALGTGNDSDTDTTDTEESDEGALGKRGDGGGRAMSSGPTSGSSGSGPNIHQGGADASGSSGEAGGGTSGMLLGGSHVRQDSAGTGSSVEAPTGSTGSESVFVRSSGSSTSGMLPAIHNIELIAGATGTVRAGGGVQATMGMAPSRPGGESFPLAIPSTATEATPSMKIVLTANSVFERALDDSAEGFRHQDSPLTEQGQSQTHQPSKFHHPSLNVAVATTKGTDGDTEDAGVESDSSASSAAVGVAGSISPSSGPPLKGRGEGVVGAKVGQKAPPPVPKRPRGPSGVLSSSGPKAISQVVSSIAPPLVVRPVPAPAPVPVDRAPVGPPPVHPMPVLTSVPPRLATGEPFRDTKAAKKALEPPSRQRTKSATLVSTIPAASSPLAGMPRPPPSTPPTPVPLRVTTPASTAAGGLPPVGPIPLPQFVPPPGAAIQQPFFAPGQQAFVAPPMPVFVPPPTQQPSPVPIPSSSSQRARPTAPEDLPHGARETAQTEQREGSTVLFIQMQLCSSTNLHKWLQARNAQRPRVIIEKRRNERIFRQIVQGLAHVHSSGFIHRDIKPGNVFLQEDDHVLLGDFGLAKDISQKQRHMPETETELVRDLWDEMLQNKEIDEAEKDMLVEQVQKNGGKIDETLIKKLAEDGHLTQTVNLTLGVGTLLYASPEQLSRRRYDSKTDIYSLGVLFFELYWPFSSAMERVMTLMDLRKGVVPEGFKRRWPKEYSVLKRMVAPDPAQRLSALEILAHPLLNTLDPLTASRYPNLSLEYGPKPPSDPVPHIATPNGAVIAKEMIIKKWNGEALEIEGDNPNCAFTQQLQSEVGEVLMGRRKLLEHKAILNPSEIREILEHDEVKSSGSSGTSSESGSSWQSGSVSSASSGDEAGAPPRTSQPQEPPHHLHHHHHSPRPSARHKSSLERLDKSVVARMYAGGTVQQLGDVDQCMECREKDMLIMALKERNAKLLDRVQRLEQVITQVTGRQLRPT